MQSQERDKTSELQSEELSERLKDSVSSVENQMIAALPHHFVNCTSNGPRNLGSGQRKPKLKDVVLSVDTFSRKNLKYMRS